MGVSYQDNVDTIKLEGCAGAMAWDQDSCSDGYSDNVALEEGETTLPSDLARDTCRIELNPIVPGKVDIGTGTGSSDLRFGSDNVDQGLVDALKASSDCDNDWCKKDWCLQYWPDSARSSDLWSRTGDAWGLYVAPCVERDEDTSLSTQGTQQFMLDSTTGQLKIFHKDLPDPKCVNVYPQFTWISGSAIVNGYFWPTDSSYSSSYGEKYIKGRYVSVEDCVDMGAVSETPHNTYGTDQMKTGKKDRYGNFWSMARTNEGQKWEQYSGSGGAYKLRNPRTGMCLALYPTICKNDNTNCKGGALVTSHFNMTIVGLDNCNSDKVFRYRDLEDNRWNQGDVGELKPLTTIQEEYQKQLLPDKSKLLDKAQVSYCVEGPGLCGDSMDGAEGNVQLGQSEVQFFFMAGEKVYSSAESNACLVGGVVSCEPWDEPIYKGCYNDMTNSVRDLPVSKGSGKDKAACMAECSGFKYFGMQWTMECFCGNTFASQGEATGCNCDADNIGANKNCIYETWDGGNCKVDFSSALDGSGIKTVAASSLSPASTSWPEPMDFTCDGDSECYCTSTGGHTCGSSLNQLCVDDRCLDKTQCNSDGYYCLSTV